MVIYRLTFAQKSPLSTPLVSGTVWGHLAWAVRYLDGESAFNQWLEEQENAPWLVSSCMPVGMIPRPLLPPTRRRSRTMSLREMEQEKRAGKIGYISEKLFLDLQNGMSEEALTEALKKVSLAHETGSPVEFLELKAHNRIDRLTGTTPEAGGLYFEEVAFPTGYSRFQLFLGAPHPCRERLETLLSFIGQNGFGANASTGNGHLDFHVEEESRLFSGDGSRAMSLSHGLISDNMGRPRYKQHVHFGKLGGEFAKGVFSAFKYPILMARPGATFDMLDEGPYGALLRGVHHDPALVGVRHHALHLPLRFREVNP